MTAITQLNAAHNLLRAAIDQYLAACSSINKANAYGRLPGEALPELAKCVSKELVLVGDLGETLLAAKAILAVTRNHVPLTVPISRLPDDVLLQIFQLVTVEKFCNSHDIDGKITRRSLGHPMLLTHVCSHWRRIAMASARLWSHIDVPSYISCDEVAVDQAKECISRAGSCALDLHFVEPDIDAHPAPTPNGLATISQLFVPVSSQIRSLDFKLGKPLRTLQCAESSAKRYSLLLSNSLKHTTTDALERLAVTIDSTTPGLPSQHYFMESNEIFQCRHSDLRVPSGNIALVSIPQQELETLLFSITSLELKGFYPRWTSKAYHGLVELRLGAYTGVSIPEADFRTILSSSPRLRHLSIGLKITRATPPILDDAPILLENLETLGTGQRSLEELDFFLGLIRPGPRPISVYLKKSGKCSSYPDIPRVPFSAQTQAFFARANVETLGIAGAYNYSQVAELLGLVPRIRVLVLNGLCLGNIGANACEEWPKPTHHLGDLYIIRETSISRHFLHWLIQDYRVQRLLFTDDSKVTQTSYQSSRHDNIALPDEVLRLGCSFESIFSRSPYPMQLWD